MLKNNTITKYISTMIKDIIHRMITFADYQKINDMLYLFKFQHFWL